MTSETEPHMHQSWYRGTKAKINLFNGEVLYDCTTVWNLYGICKASSLADE